MDSIFSYLEERAGSTTLLVLYCILTYISCKCITYCVRAMKRLVHTTVLNLRLYLENLYATISDENFVSIEESSLPPAAQECPQHSIATGSSSIAVSRPQNNVSTMEIGRMNENIIAPDDCVQRQIVSIVNSLCQRNLQTKCEEIKDIISDDCLPWISNYMVMNLIGMKSDNHLLYLNFLDCLKNKSLNLLIKSVTINNIKVLLKRDKRKFDNRSETLLSNLGHWFGMITIGKSKPIATIFGDFETLLVNAYYKSDKDFYYIVLFIENIMESCANSRVYNTKNPWTIKIMNLFAEIHQKADLDPYLKFCIEYLCKSLKLHLRDLKPGYMLRRKIINKVQLTTSADLSTKTIYYYS